MKKRQQVDDDNGFAEHGGYMAAKVTKLEEQFSTIQNACKKKSNIFEGISIFVNGYTTPSAEELKRIMMEHSGWCLVSRINQIYQVGSLQELFIITKDRTQNL